MGVCLNHNCIKNNNLDDKFLIDNVLQTINNDKDADKYNEKKSEIYVNNIESDLKTSLLNKDMIEKDINNIDNNYKIITCKIQSKYKTKFFNYSPDKNIKNIKECNYSQAINREINSNIYFTNFIDKKANAYSSTADNSGIK